MSTSHDVDHSDDEEPNLPGVPEQPAPPEVVRLEPTRSPPQRTRTPDLVEEQARRESTIRTVQNQGPEQSWLRPERRLPPFRIIGLAILLILITISGALLGVRLLSRHRPTPEAVTPAPRPARPFLETASVEEIEAQTLATVKGFMNAETPAERCRFVIGGKKLAEKMRAFYERPGSPAPAPFGSILKVQDGAFGGHPIKIVFAAEDNGTVGWSFVLVSLRDRLAIDWEASVAYGQLSWDDLLRDQPRQPVQMRVYLRRMPDEASPSPERHLYQVSARRSETPLLATVPTNSPAAIELARTVPPGASQPVNIRLRWPPPSTDIPHAEITELLHNFWIDTERLGHALELPPAPIRINLAS